LLLSTETQQPSEKACARHHATESHGPESLALSAVSSATKRTVFWARPMGALAAGQQPRAFQDRHLGGRSTALWQIIFRHGAKPCRWVCPIHSFNFACMTQIRSNTRRQTQEKRKLERFAPLMCGQTPIYTLEMGLLYGRAMPRLYIPTFFYQDCYTKILIIWPRGFSPGLSAPGPFVRP
jgi:hypothetical protein